MTEEKVVLNSKYGGLERLNTLHLRQHHLSEKDYISTQKEKQLAWQNHHGIDKLTVNGCW